MPQIKEHPLNCSSRDGGAGENGPAINSLDLSRRLLSSIARNTNECRIQLEGFTAAFNLKTLLTGYSQRLDTAIERLDQSSVRLVKTQGLINLLGRQNKPPHQIIDSSAETCAGNGDTKPINTAQNSAKTQQLEVSRKLLESVSFKRIIDRGYTVIWDENSSQ